MCGIAGFISPDKSHVKSVQDRNDLDIIRHRGPDRQSDLNLGNLWMGHTRLSILDLSNGGDQPMVSKCGRFSIAFNGEIYNHLDLRKKYLSDFQFRGHSDTETVLELFCLLGDKMLSELVGMWALILWDMEAEVLFISRDRFGQKPLYYQFLPDGVYFGSEIKLFLKFQSKLTFNTTAVSEYLSSGNYGHLGTETFYNEITQFPVASFAYFNIGDKQLNPDKYWEIPKKPKRIKSFGQKELQTLKELLVEAVLSQTLADVPIGITLSGGIDSSIIAGILAKYHTGHLHIFTAQNPSDPKDESAYVSDVIKRFDQNRVTIHYVDLGKISYENLLEESLEIQEEPFGDPSISAHSLLMKAAKKAGIKVVLGGQGADELFAGYDHSLGGVLAAQLNRGKFKRFARNFKNLNWGKANWMKFWMAFLFPRIEKKLRESRKIQREEYIPFTWKVNKRKITLVAPTDFDQLIHESLFGIHLPHLLHYDDRNAMNEGVEGRTPFLDHRILDFLMSISPDEFLRDGRRKSLLRDSCSEFLPESVLKRKDKIGFHTPLLAILQSDIEKISLRFKQDLPQEVRSRFLDDLNQLKNKFVPLEVQLRVYRTYSILLTCERMNVEFKA